MDALAQQDAILQGVAADYKWWAQFKAEWEEGIMKGNLKQAFALMPPEMKEELKRRDPEGYQRVLDMIEGESNYG